MKLTPKSIGIITLLVYWGPSNALFYFWGFLLLGFIVMAKPEWVKVKGFFSSKILIYSLVFFSLFLVSFVVNQFLGNGSPNNFFWSILTYGSTFGVMIALLMIPFTRNDLKGIFKFSLYLSILQVFLGYFQMVQSYSFRSLDPFAGGIDMGDFFVGTTFDPGIGSFVAIKMGMMTLMFLPFWFAQKNLRNSIYLVLLLLGWILPSAIYTLILGLLVVAFHYIVKSIWRALYTFKMSTAIFYMTLVGIGLFVVFAYTHQRNISYAVYSLNSVYSTITGVGKVESSRKVLYYKNTFSTLPVEHPEVFLAGVGPGNYSSRSAWLVSGEYLARQPAYIAVTPSDVAQEFTISLWSKDLISQTFKGAGSIRHQPFSSWVSVFSEIGLPGLIIFILIFSTFHKSFNKTIRQQDDDFISDLAIGVKLSLMFIVLLFFVENLFEWPLVMGQFFIFAAPLTKFASRDA